MADRLLVELMVLREQLMVAARSPGVLVARRLTAEVMPVLEPVWSVLVDEGEGVGFLRRLDTDDEHTLNTDVKCQIVRTYRSLDLTGPDMRTVWRVLSRPSTALVDSVRNPPRPRRIVGDGPVRATLGASVRPALPDSLLGKWRDDIKVVPALRRVLRMWCEMARHSIGERREVARLTLAAAMLARGAVLDGDTETVKWFVKRWLGLIATDSRIDGMSAALLEDGWHHRAVDDEFSAIRDSVTNLRIEALYQHRLHRPAWETQLRGAPVALLGETAEFILQSSDEEMYETISKILLVEQVNSVLATLSERESGVIRLWIIQGYTLGEIAQVYGVSKYCIAQVRDSAMNKLRHSSRSQILEGYW
jgi:DNA-directed RNA polymerase specialized sigma24 family protein